LENILDILGPGSQDVTHLYPWCVTLHIFRLDANGK
jgi:hypothetical protein